MLRTTPLGWHEGSRGLHRVEITSETALPHQTVDSGWVAVALSLVPIQVVPPREVVVAEAADEPGASYPPHVPLRQSLLAGAAAECHRGYLAYPRLAVGHHASSLLSIT